MGADAPREPRMRSEDIVQVVPAPPGWRAVYTATDGGRASHDVIGWAVCQRGSHRQVIGMVTGQLGRLALVSELIDYAAGDPALYVFQTPERWAAQDDEDDAERDDDARRGR